MVSTLDFESSDPGSNPGGSFLAVPKGCGQVSSDYPSPRIAPQSSDCPQLQVFPAPLPAWGGAPIIINFRQPLFRVVSAVDYGLRTDGASSAKGRESQALMTTSLWLSPRMGNRPRYRPSTVNSCTRQAINYLLSTDNPR